jgi:hypothetical protein
MRSTLLPFCPITVCFSLLVSATPANAQCDANSVGYGNVGIVTDNPFHAEIVTTPGPTEPESIVTRYPKLVARDSKGRIRIDRVGEVKRDDGPHAGTMSEMHVIMICDPVAQTTTQLDALNSTAKILHSPPSAQNSSRVQGAPRTFCSTRVRLNPREGVVGRDLGVQTIQGVEAHGAQSEFVMGVTTFVGTTKTSLPPSYYAQDIWCSDELSAVVLTVTQDTKTGERSTVAMQNIDRTEPDASLFRIPPDYKVIETNMQPVEHHTKGASTPKPAENP